MELEKSVFIKGENIFLRCLDSSDITGNYATWLNDPKVTEFNSHGRFPMTSEKLESYVKHIQVSNKAFVLAIIDSESQSHIGNISLQNINWIDRNAEIAFLLGESSFWGKGIMFEAGRLLIEHGFKMLNLHRIYCGTSSNNIGMQRLAEKLGMNQEGVRKDALFKNGVFVDIIEYGIVFKEEK
jgi:ribosomal-protein-alanine N-acetyltransferase